jgi:hypothetical protein
MLFDPSTCATCSQVLEKLLLAGYEADTMGGPCEDSPEVGSGPHDPPSASAAPATGKAASRRQAGAADGSAAPAPSSGASAASSGGHTALHLAASQGHCAAVAVLLQHGGAVCVGRRDWRGCTPLLRAAEGGHRGAFELLLMVGVLRCAIPVR